LFLLCWRSVLEAPLEFESSSTLECFHYNLNKSIAKVTNEKSQEEGKK
jgi:hypothetical protein